MTDKITILKELKENLRKQFQDTVRDVILFGSQAKGAADDDSDFDILIILAREYTGKDENKILDICYEIDLKYNIIIDAHLLSLDELSTLRGGQPVYINALNTGIYA